MKMYVKYSLVAELCQKKQRLSKIFKRNEEKTDDKISINKIDINKINDERINRFYNDSVTFFEENVGIKIDNENYYIKIYIDIFWESYKDKHEN